ncbi:aspartic peptidase domain-containing protein, partial [Lipomyces kononenkoae]
MKDRIICLVAAGVSLAVGSAATDSLVAPHLEPRSYCGIPQLSVERVKLSRAGAVRRDVVPVSLDNKVMYLTTINLGTPRQPFQVKIDTARSDLVVLASTDPFCSQGNCDYSNTFDASASSTFDQLQNVSFAITFDDGTGANGTYGADTFNIGNATLKNFIFGYAEYSDTSLGVLGISYPRDEASMAHNVTYANLPYSLQDAGIIDLVAYSLWLNDLDANTGSILFGGIDTGKFTGELAVIPMHSINSNYIDFNVTLTGITVLSGSNETVVYGTTDAVIPRGDGPNYVVLQSDSSYGAFSFDVLEAIVNGLGLSDSVTYSYGFYLVDCSFMNSDARVVFEFDHKASITVTMHQLIQVLFSSSGGNTCGIALQDWDYLPGLDQSAYIAGDSILSSAYVVYDLENHMIGIAQTSFNSSVTNLLSLSSSGIPESLIGTGANNSAGSTSSAPTSAAT